MKFKVILDENNYLQSFVHTNSSEDNIELQPENMDLDHLNCYQFVDNNVLLDEEKLATVKNQESVDEEIVELKQKLTKTDYIWNAIREGAHDESYYAETIANRKAWRTRIQELENELAK